MYLVNAPIPSLSLFPSPQMKNLGLKSPNFNYDKLLRGKSKEGRGAASGGGGGYTDR
jgi:hypothetical protein